MRCIAKIERIKSEYRANMSEKWSEKADGLSREKMMIINEASIFGNFPYELSVLLLLLYT